MSEEGPNPLPPRDWTPDELAHRELMELRTGSTFRPLHRFGSQLTAEEQSDNLRIRHARMLAELDIRIKHGVELEHLRELNKKYRSISTELMDVHWEIAQLEEKIRNRHRPKTD